MEKAYYNLGVELEYLKEFSKAKVVFEKTKLGETVLPEISQKASEQREEHLRRT